MWSQTPLFDSIMTDSFTQCLSLACAVLAVRLPLMQKQKAGADGKLISTVISENLKMNPVNLNLKCCG